MSEEMRWFQEKRRFMSRTHAWALAQLRQERRKGITRRQVEYVGGIFDGQSVSLPSDQTEMRFLSGSYHLWTRVFPSTGLTEILVWEGPGDE